MLPGLLWTAPEFVRNEETEAFGSQKGDVYSFAIILYEIYGKNGPFGDTHLTAKGLYATRTSPPKVCTRHAPQRHRSVPACTSPSKVCTRAVAAGTSASMVCTRALLLAVDGFCGQI